MDGASEESSSLVKLALLTAVAKMFFKRPPECQEMLGRLLEHSIGEAVFVPIIITCCFVVTMSFSHMVSRILEWSNGQFLFVSYLTVTVSLSF